MSKTVKHCDNVLAKGTTITFYKKPQIFSDNFNFKINKTD